MEEDVLSEEENKAIETLKDFNEAIKYKSCISIPYNTKLFDTILNLIEKQQKEIEELKEENKQYKIQEDLTFECLDKTKYMSNYISKDEIIKLLNKYDKASFIAKVDLQELLEGDK